MAEGLSPCMLLRCLCVAAGKSTAGMSSTASAREPPFPTGLVGPTMQQQRTPHTLHPSPPFSKVWPRFTPELYIHTHTRSHCPLGTPCHTNGKNPRTPFYTIAKRHIGSRGKRASTEREARAQRQDVAAACEVVSTPWRCGCGSSCRFGGCCRGV